MIYCFVCKDGPQAPALRKDLLQRHLEHIKSVMEHVTVAGPVRDAEGNFLGSIIMLEAETEDDAWEMFNRDPYAKAEIWDSIKALPFDAVAGRWVGGAAWQNPSP